MPDCLNVWLEVRVIRVRQQFLVFSFYLLLSNASAKFSILNSQLTKVPIASPLTTFSRLPGWFMSNT